MHDYIWLGRTGCASGDIEQLLYIYAQLALARLNSHPCETEVLIHGGRPEPMSNIRFSQFPDPRSKNNRCHNHYPLLKSDWG